MKTVLKKIGYTIRNKDISDDMLNTIKEELTVQPFINPEFNGSVEKFKLYIKKKNKIIVPRYYGVKKFGKPTKDKLGNYEKKENLKFVYSLRENQVPAIDACLKEFNTNGGCLLCAGCGFGKTSCSLYLACKLNVKTLVIVHKHFLLNQWISSINKFAPNAKVGTIRGKTIDIEDKDIVIGMLQSISMKDYDKDVFKDFGLTIIDECFPAGTQVYTNKGFISIEKLKDYVGSLSVLSYNHNTKSYESKLITNWFENKPKNCIELTYIDKNNNNYNNNYNNTNKQYKLICSYDHRIFSITRNKYVYAKDIDNGYENILGINNKIYTVINKKYIGEKGNLYDIEVQDNHNFFVSGNKKCNNFILVHNCHHIGSEVFSQALPKISTKYMLGLTATPNRKDGLTKVFKWYLGDIAYKVSSMKSFEVLVKNIKFKSTNNSYSREEKNFKNQVIMPTMINNICNYIVRNKLILDIIEKIIKLENRQLLVLSNRRNHLNYLKNEIDKFQIMIKDNSSDDNINNENNNDVNNDDDNENNSGKLRVITTGFYVGGAQSKKKDKELKESESKDVIFGTYEMAREGLDIPSLNSLLLASPVSDVEQAVGRILRKKSEIVPLIVDVSDCFSLFNSMSYKRLNLYKKNEFLVSTNTFVDENIDVKNDTSLINIDTSKITFNIEEEIETIKKNNENKDIKKNKANPFSSDSKYNKDVNKDVNKDTKKNTKKDKNKKSKDANDNKDSNNINDSSLKLAGKKSCYVFLSSDEED